MAGGIDSSVSDLRLTASRAGQPVYTALLQSGPDDAETAVAVDARTGRRLPPASQDVVLASARTYLQHDGRPTSESAPSSKPDQAEPALTYEGTIDEDPHTHSRSLDPYRPLHKVQLPDADRTLLYIADTTGEVVSDAPHTEHTLDYVGTWLHWLYMFRGGSFDA